MTRLLDSVRRHLQRIEHIVTSCPLTIAMDTQRHGLPDDARQRLGKLM